MSVRQPISATHVSMHHDHPHEQLSHVVQGYAARIAMCWSCPGLASERSVIMNVQNDSQCMMRMHMFTTVEGEGKLY